METNDRTLLDEWMANWSDLIDFEIHSVAPPKKSSETPSKISCVPPKKQPLALGAASTRFQVPQFQGQKREKHPMYLMLSGIGFRADCPPTLSY